MSVVLSFKTSALTSINIKAEAKSFFPLIPKLVLGLRYLLIFLIRIGTIVFYFAPFIGILDIMSHHHAESIPLDYEAFSYVNDTLTNPSLEYHYWNEKEQNFQSISISQLYRSEYTDTKFPLPPSPTLYTVISLGTGYIFFWAMMVMYGLILTGIKYCLSNDFRLSTVWEKLQHIVEALNVPEIFGDWDNDHDLDVAGHLNKWWKVLVEMLVMTSAQLIFNLFLLVPIWITGMKLNMKKILLIMNQDFFKYLFEHQMVKKYKKVR